MQYSVFMKCRIESFVSGGAETLPMLTKQKLHGCGASATENVIAPSCCGLYLMILSFYDIVVNISSTAARKSTNLTQLKHDQSL